MNSSLQSLKENGKPVEALPFYQRQLYRLIFDTLTLVDQDWLTGTWDHTRINHAGLYARIRELEGKIEQNYPTNVPDTYRETRALIAAWGSALKEMIFLHRSHLEEQSEKTRPSALAGPRSSSTGKPRPLPGPLPAEDQTAQPSPAAGPDKGQDQQ